MTSAERVFEYAQIKPEPDNGCNYGLEPTWPNSGSITADSASFSYHSSLKNVLNKLNFTVRSKEKVFCRLTLSWRRPLLYGNHSIDLPSKSMHWFLYDNGLRHERVNIVLLCTKYMHIWLAMLFWSDAILLIIVNSI